MEKYIVRIPKVGTIIDNGIGDCEFSEWQQELRIQRIKEQWKETIKCQKCLKTKFMYNVNHNPSHWIEYFIEDNPYYGWKEEQLEIIIE